MLKTLFQKREAIPPNVREGARDAAESMFASMFGGSPPASKSVIVEITELAVVGVISFVGDVSYSFALILPEETAPNLARDFAGMEMEIDDPNMLYVAGELSNLIAGDLVARMEANHIKTRMSLPSLARGKELLRSLSLGREIAEMVFTLPQGDVMCQLASGPRFEHASWPGE